MQSRGDALTQTFHICAAAAKMRGNRRWKGACDGQTVVTDEAAEPIDVDERQSSWSDGRSLQPVKLTKQWSDFYYRAGGIYSGKRNATVWRPSVSLYTYRDSPAGSMRRGQRTFRPNNMEDRHTCVELRRRVYQPCDSIHHRLEPLQKV